MQYILKTIVGSQAHGLATPESDYDYRGVFVVPTREILQLEANIKNTHWIEGKTDDTSWEIGHFLKMAVHCNPTILETFLAPRVIEGAFEAHIEGEELEEISLVGVNVLNFGTELRSLFPYVWNSREVYDGFLGYSENQRKKFLDRKDERPHKYAQAYLRVLFQGVQLLETGTFTVSMVNTPIYETLKRWRNKEYEPAEVLRVCSEWEQKLMQAYGNNPDKQTDIEKVNEFLLRVRKACWE